MIDGLFLGGCRRLALAAAIIFVGGEAVRAGAVLQFGQVGSSPIVFAADNGTSTSPSTTISITNGVITVTNYASSSPMTPFNAFFNLTAGSTNAATQSGTADSQSFSGMFQITSGMDGTGSNYLSGTFIDAFSGKDGGGSASITASTPPANSVTFTSDYFITSGNKNLGFSLADLVNNSQRPGTSASGLQIFNNSIDSFKATITGNFSADTITPTPEPTSIALIVAGVPAFFLLRRKFA